MHHIAVSQAVLLLILALGLFLMLIIFHQAKDLVLQESISCLWVFLKCNLVNSMLKDDFWGALPGIDSLSCVLTAAEAQVWQVTNNYFVQEKKFQRGNRRLIF